MGLTLDTYAGRKVLITGHTGFKGGWLSLWLHHLGARVSGIGLAPDTEASLFTETQLDKTVHSHFADIRNLESISNIVADEQPEIIFHMAAQALVRHGLKFPLETFSTNVMGTANILETARINACVRAIVVITTDKCYENRGWEWGYRETDRLGGHDPYSASKACAELAVTAWRKSYWQAKNAPLVATARAGNVIGGGDWAMDRLVPDLIRATHSGQPALIRNPAAVRPWQHVLEPLTGYMQLGARLLAGEHRFARAWNFGPTLDDMQPVSNLCNILCQILGGRWQHDNEDHPTEVTALRLDSSRAALELGWRQRWPLAKALHATGEWYARQKAGESSQALVLEQIRAYEATKGGLR